MPELTIDISEDEESDFYIENYALDLIRVGCAGVDIELTWQQAERLHKVLGELVSDDAAGERQ